MIGPCGKVQMSYIVDRVGLCVCHGDFTDVKMF